jgi:hypothetical protein
MESVDWELQTDDYFVDGNCLTGLVAGTALVSVARTEDGSEWRADRIAELTQDGGLILAHRDLIVCLSAAEAEARRVAAELVA